MHAVTAASPHGTSAYARVRQLIVDGEVTPGEPLREQTLARRLAMSRTPVREALRRLESDGLVHSTGRGVVVASLGREEVRSAYEVRMALEALTAELAAERQRRGRIAPADLEDVRRAAVDAERATASGRLDDAVAHNRRLHAGIARLSGSAVAIHVLDQLWDRILVSTRSYLETADEAAEVAADHRTILDAIAGGQVDRAGRAARDHVMRTLAYMDRAE
jgi:DNA-binding GntR family transcriptional regulator